MPADLATLYGGPLDLRSPLVYANFVSSLDGVVALEAGRAPSGGIISGRNEADRFVMGLLRAFADAILIGAGTVRAEGGRALWTPEYIFPSAAEGYRALRRSLGRSESPRLVIVTARGDLSPTEPALQAGALVLTSRATEASLRARLPSASQVKAVSDDGSLNILDVLRAIRDEGHQVILTEGGPHLFGQLVAARAVDELFSHAIACAGRALAHEFARPDPGCRFRPQVDVGETGKSAAGRITSVFALPPAARGVACPSWPSSVAPRVASAAPSWMRLPNVVTR